MLTVGKFKDSLCDGRTWTRMAKYYGFPGNIKWGLTVCLKKWSSWSCKGGPFIQQCLQTGKTLHIAKLDWSSLRSIQGTTSKYSKYVHLILILFIVTYLSSYNFLVLWNFSHQYELWFRFFECIMSSHNWDHFSSMYLVHASYVVVKWIPCQII